MINLNPLFFPTLLLAGALFGIAFRFASRSTHRRTLLFGMGAALVTPLPALLYCLTYLHLFDRAIWFYELRAFPGSELLAAGLGWTAGMAAGRLQREASGRLSKGFVRTLQGLVVFCLVLILSVPYAKSVIAPLRGVLPARWSNGVCIQSTPSTCGPASAATLLAGFGRAVSERELAQACFTYGGGTENWYLARALRRQGLQIRYVVQSPAATTLPFPSIAGTEYHGRGGSGHFIVILGQQDGRFLIGDPLVGRLLLTPEQLHTQYDMTGFFMVAADSRAPVRAASGAAFPLSVDPYHLHGAVITHRYPSRTFGGLRRLHVYTPPGYDPDNVLRYPVLYLLTGSPGDDTNWTAVGKAHLLLDAQINAHQCEPCIVVMPDSEFRHKRYGRHGFEHDLFTDIIPLIERTYRTRTDADSRAIAGLSMGGFYSIEIGLNHLDRFAWIGVFSAGLRSGFVTAADITGLNTNPQSAVAHLKLFYVRIGKRDFFLPDARRLDTWLSRQSIRHVYQEVEGTHEWPVWERALADFAPRLFKKASS
jgi:enterochelin esterase-like enzyme